MFKEKRTEPMFVWDYLGDIKEGRPNLGTQMDVICYRLMQFTLRDVLIQEFGPEKAEEIVYKAGELAGREFFKNVVTEKEDFDKFVSNIQELLKTLKIGILKIEKADVEKLEFTITVAEDLDCSGLPVCDEEVCTYDEGFLNGVLSEFTGKEFSVKEVDCWCSGDRVCRFDVKPAS